MTSTLPETEPDGPDDGTRPSPPDCEYADCSHPAVDVISGKKFCKDHCTQKGLQIVTIQGQKYFAVIVDFDDETSYEHWSEYRLLDGSDRILRVRHIVKRVQRIIGLPTADGSETYTFQSDLVSDVQDPAPSPDCDQLKRIVGASSRTKEQSLE